MRLSLWFAVLLGVACTSSRPQSSTSGGNSQGATSSSSTGGVLSGTSDGGSTSGTGTSGSGTGGSSTGGTTGSQLVDGGYVICTLPNAPDAGPSGDGGVASWLCQPGTYFCDSAGKIGNCFQCRNDGDCTNQDLPTRDPTRSHCDLDSGVLGFQNFCQQCTNQADCLADPSGAYCNLDAGALGGAIDDLGFETCGPVPRPGPVACFSNGYVEDGGCIPPFTCSSDQACAGLISTAQQLVPFCVGGSCNSCDGGLCPGNFCLSDESCGSLNGSADAGLSCNTSWEVCGCTSDESCAGFWPVCEGLDSGYVNFAGQPIGSCGCDRDDECGDAGLSCLRTFGPTGSGSECGVSCLGPRLPNCLVLVGQDAPFCDPVQLRCEDCGSDNQCQASRAASLTGPYCRLDGACGCQVSEDCPTGQTCQPPFIPSTDDGRIGLCAPPPPRCTPASCNGELCDPDGGCEYHVACASDYDCSIPTSSEPTSFCDVDAGTCLQCLDNLDCIKGGFASQGASTCDFRFYCSQQCVTDHDCVGNSMGSICMAKFNSFNNSCGCGTDQECSGNPQGPHCDTNSSDQLYGLCICFSGSECAVGAACQIASGGTSAQCDTFCQVDTDCPPNFSCDPTATCRPRCDQGKSCGSPDSICDSDNVVGHNGEPASGGASPVWCYQCLTAADCGPGLGCGADTQYTCGSCGQSADCRPDEVCLNGTCHAGCDAGACPSDQMCDALGLAGHGTNICYQCIGPMDCPEGLGCDDVVHACGSCRGPTARGGPYDCPPAAICSNYWSQDNATGVCLQDCDDSPCPAGTTCQLFPSLTPDHKYCFGCLQDSDCADAGLGAWCDVSVNLAFACQPGVIP